MKAPLFTLPTINEEGTYNLSEDIHNKIIIITFWASWCPDCSRDLPKKEQLFQSMDKEKVKMVTINVVGRERNEQDGLNFAQQFLSQTTLKDNGREVYNLYECKEVPTTVIIDKSGNIFEKFGDKANILDIVQTVGKIID